MGIRNRLTCYLGIFLPLINFMDTIPVINFGNTSFQFLRIPVTNKANIAIRFWESQLLISEKPVIDFGVVSESVLSKIWTRLVAKSEVLKSWGWP